MIQPKGLLNQDVELSAASILYAVWILTRASRSEYPSVVYNYYDGYQELTKELADKGYAAIGEFMDDEVSMITGDGYALIRNRYWFTLEQIAVLDQCFKLVIFPEIIP